MYGLTCLGIADGGRQWGDRCGAGRLPGPFPRARVITLIPIFFFIQVVEIPAILYLGFWFLSQLLSGAFALAADTFQGGGVAWWAHIGGFVAGAVLVWLFAPRRPQRYYPDQYRPW